MNMKIGSVVYLTRVARAAMRSASPAGGDSFLRFRYAVRRRSVERSLSDARLEALGADICDAEVDARGSVISFRAHWTTGQR